MSGPLSSAAATLQQRRRKTRTKTFFIAAPTPSPSERASSPYSPYRGDCPLPPPSLLGSLDPRRDPVGNLDMQRRLAGAALQAHPIAVAHAAHFRVLWIDLQHVLGVPLAVFGAARLGAYIVLREDATRGQQQGKARSATLLRRHIFGDDEFAFSSRKAVDVHDRHAVRRVVVARPLHGALFLEPRIGDVLERRRHARDLIQDLAWMRIAPIAAHRIGEELGRLPIRVLRLGTHHAPNALDTPLGVDEAAVLLEEARAGQQD